MQKWFKIPLYFLLIAAALGVMLRLQLVYPLQGIRYPFWLHAHSHIMFLGWIFNVLNLCYVHFIYGWRWPTRYRVLFWINQVMLVGMLVSFPMQGYGPVSIIISTIHTVVTGIFCFLFFKESSAGKWLWMAKASLVFFLVSAVGPFSLGPIMANGLGQTKWYYFAIYYYLHFQYNGVFTFGAFALFLKLLQDKSVEFDSTALRRFSLLLAISCLPAYILSVLWSDPGLMYNAFGLAAGLLQIVAVAYLLLMVRTIQPNAWTRFSVTSRALLIVAALSFFLKISLQLLSAHPGVAQLAYDNRYYVIAYLHLVLIGFISLSILVWYIETGIAGNFRTFYLSLIIGGFLITELIMVLVPTAPLVARNSGMILFIFSLIMFVGFAGLVLRPKKH